MVTGGVIGGIAGGAVGGATVCDQPAKEMQVKRAAQRIAFPDREEGKVCGKRKKFLISVLNEICWLAE